MLPLEHHLKRAGYEICNIDYPSRAHTIEELTDIVHKKIDTDPKILNAEHVSFVAHSLGGLVTRQYISKYRPANLGKVVMLGTPNHGSDLADYLHEHEHLGAIYKAVYGPAGKQLMRGNCFDEEDIDYPLGIIAGNASINPLASIGLSKHKAGEHDGVVPIACTKHKDMCDHITLKTSHTEMIFNPTVMAQVVCFLRDGRFEKP